MISEERVRYGKDSARVSFWISRIGSTYDDSEQLAATSPARQADRIKCPVLLMHGEGDTTVQIEQSEIMADAMRRAGKQVEFIRFPDEDHYFNLADTRIRFLKETEAFLNKYIGH
jgi:dipeptidyl aminopeptidase/acylaminoacyl peptidase